MRVSQGALPRLVGRYAIYGEIAAGGMGTVNYGRLRGPVGFSRTVAIKCLHPQFAKDPSFVAMFIDEARLAARIRHPNVVQTTDVVATEGELFLVMEFVQGESLARLLRAAAARPLRLPLDVASAIACSVLHGLHAAHEATNEKGERLGIVHRDVSPQNVIVGADGAVRVLDFGIAKASGRSQTTRDGQVKGKLAYMAPEQLRGGEVDRRTDVFAMGIVVWEMLTAKRLFSGDSEGMVVTNVLEQEVPPPSAIHPDSPPALDAIVLRALARDASKRYATAEEMALAIEAAVPMASHPKVGRLVADLAGDALAKRAQTVKAIEASSEDANAAVESIPDLDPSDVAVAEPTKSNTAIDAQPSSLSLSGPLPRAPAHAPRTGLLAVVGAGAILALSVVVYAASRSHSPPPAASATPEANQPTPTASTAPYVPAETAVPPVVAEEPAPTPSAAPAAPKSPPSPAAAAAAPATAAPTPTTAPGGKPCPLKSYFDSNGIKHYEHRCQ